MTNDDKICRAQRQCFEMQTLYPSMHDANYIADCHLHTEFSTDSETPMEAQIQQAIRLGMKHICITDHMDFDFPSGEFSIDTDKYVQQILDLREKYKEQIFVGLGVELGLQYHLKDTINAYLKKYPFDFAIGSIHLLHGEDPYTGAIFERVGDEEAYREYFRETQRILTQAPDIDSFGHLDYIVRYGKRKAEDYSYRKFADEIDAILRTLIDKDIALEVNAAGFRTLGFTNPHRDVIRRYRELGGEKLTIGSDGHVPEYLGYRFGEFLGLLSSCGFKYYTIFKQRKEIFCTIV